MARAVWRWLDWTLRGLLVLLLLGMTGVSFLQVIARYVFNNALPWPDELAEFLFIYVVFLGAAVCMQERSHFTVDYVPSLLPRRLRLLIEIAGYGIGLP